MLVNSILLCWLFYFSGNPNDKQVRLILLKQKAGDQPLLYKNQYLWTEIIEKQFLSFDHQQFANYCIGLCVYMLFELENARINDHQTLLELVEQVQELKIVWNNQKDLTKSKKRGLFLYIWVNGQLQKEKDKVIYLNMSAFVYRFYLFTSSLSLSSSYWNIDGGYFSQRQHSDRGQVFVTSYIVMSIISIQRSSTDEIVKESSESQEFHRSGWKMNWLTFRNEPHSPTEIFGLSPEAVAQMNHLTYLPETPTLVLGDNPIFEDSRTFILVSHSQY